MARRKGLLDELVRDIEASAGAALAVEADLAQRAQAQAAVARMVAHFGRLDTVVNNTGLMIIGPALGADTEDWERMIAINLLGLVHTTHAALPHLVQAAES